MRKAIVGGLAVTASLLQGCTMIGLVLGGVSASRASAEHQGRIASLPAWDPSPEGQSALDAALAKDPDLGQAPTFWSSAKGPIIAGLLLDAMIVTSAFVKGRAPDEPPPGRPGTGGGTFGDLFPDPGCIYCGEGE